MITNGYCFHVKGEMRKRKGKREGNGNGDGKGKNESDVEGDVVAVNDWDG